MLDDQLSEIIPIFTSVPPIQIVPLSDGHIHDTWVITTNNQEKFVLQRINNHVFPDPSALMQNIDTVCNYLQTNFPEQVNLTLVPTVFNQSFFLAENGSAWRMFVFIDHIRESTIQNDLRFYYEAGKITGMFNFQMANLSPQQVSTLIPDFHNTPLRFRKLMDFAATLPAQNLQTCQMEIDWLEHHQHLLGKIWNALSASLIPWRINHNDSKIENILFNRQTGNAICLIDFDTIMPGNLLFDYGDALRSMTNSTSEDQPDLHQIRFRLDVFKEYSRGFIPSALPILNQEEILLLPYAPFIITVEQGIRFLLDYLQGNIYYKMDYPDQNLARCRNQLKLAELMKENFDHMNASIQEIIEKIEGF